MLSRVFAFASLLIAAQAQQVGTVTAETHPALTVSKCTSSGCTNSAQSIVLDSNWRWLHQKTGGTTNCYDGNTWSTALCPDNVQCAANCALEGADYSSVYGITTSGNALRLNFVTKGAGTNVGSRTYLMAAGSTTQYQVFNLLAAEFTFTVDVSKLPCGLNGALYFSQMSADGDMGGGNLAGAKYGTGYCDAQCPRDLKFIKGKANVEGWDSATNSANSGTGGRGACCNEMDIWEANSFANAYTPHPCDSAAGLDECSGLSCGLGDRYASKCDADGCDINPYRMGNLNFYGPGASNKINTNLPFTVITQFLTNTGTATGTLVEIKRFYTQGGITYSNPQSKIPGITGNSISDAYCANQKTVFGEPHNEFGAKGGLAKQGAALKNSVLVMSIWDDYFVSMLWLNSPYPVDADPSALGVTRGPCSRTSGNPVDLEANSPNAYVIYSDIRWGPINSTFPWQNVVNPDGGSTPVSTTTTMSRTTSAGTTTRTTTRGATTPVITTTRTTTRSTTAATTTSSSGNGQLGNHWDQCGGSPWSGPTACVSPYKCVFVNQWYSQCL